MRKLNVLDQDIIFYSFNEEDHISITDIALSKSIDQTGDLIRNWIRNRNTKEVLDIWGLLNNKDFKPVEFDGFKKQADLNSFSLTPKQWIESSSAIGLISAAGPYGRTQDFC